jgi:hypothetical protein
MPPPFLLCLYLFAGIHYVNMDLSQQQINKRESPPSALLTPDLLFLVHHAVVTRSSNLPSLKDQSLNYFQNLN